MQKLISGLIALAILINISSTVSASEGLSLNFLQVIESPLMFSEVEQIRRNPGVGLYDGGSLHLQEWSPIGQHAFVGLDSHSHLYQVVELDDRTIALLLSGTQQIASYYISDSGHLFAINSDGHLLQFYHPIWSHSPAPQLLIRHFKEWGTVQSLLLSGLALYYSLAGASASPSWFEIATAVGFTTVSSSMIHAFRWLVEYEKRNAVPDGFMRIHPDAFPIRRSEPTQSVTGDISDYQLIGHSETRSLKEWIGSAESLWDRDWRQTFERRCEHALLPRGIPPSEF